MRHNAEGYIVIEKLVESFGVIFFYKLFNKGDLAST